MEKRGVFRPTLWLDEGGTGMDWSKSAFVPSDSVCVCLCVCLYNHNLEL